jgi:hypothetical protein
VTSSVVAVSPNHCVPSAADLRPSESAPCNRDIVKVASCESDGKTRKKTRPVLIKQLQDTTVSMPRSSTQATTGDWLYITQSTARHSKHKFMQQVNTWTSIWSLQANETHMKVKACLNVAICAS